MPINSDTHVNAALDNAVTYLTEKAFTDAQKEVKRIGGDKNAVLRVIIRAAIEGALGIVDAYLADATHAGQTKGTSAGTTNDFLAALLHGAGGIGISTNPTTGEVTISGSGAPGDHTVLASGTDTTPGTLGDKLVIGAGLKDTLENPGGDEHWLVESLGKVAETSGGTPDYMDQKVEDDGIFITVSVDGVTHKLKIAGTGKTKGTAGGSANDYLNGLLVNGGGITLTWNVTTGVGTFSFIPTPRVSSVASTAAITPEISTYDLFKVYALTVGLTINAHSTSTPTDGQKMEFMVYSAAAQTITHNAIYVARGVPLPTTTVAGKWTRWGVEWNSTTSKWECIAGTQET